jgi:hypothetical protein
MNWIRAQRLVLLRRKWMKFLLQMTTTCNLFSKGSLPLCRRLTKICQYIAVIISEFALVRILNLFLKQGERLKRAHVTDWNDRFKKLSSNISVVRMVSLVGWPITVFYIVPANVQHPSGCQVLQELSTQRGP